MNISEHLTQQHHPTHTPHQRAEPYLSAESLYFVVDKIVPAQKHILSERLGKQHKAPNLLNELISHADLDISRLALACYGQVFWWRSMAVDRQMSDDVRAKIFASFGSVEKFVWECQRAITWDTRYLFALHHQGRIKLATESTSEASSVIALLHEGAVPILAINLNESAYYLDYRDRRDDYVRDFFAHLIDWGFVRQQLFAPKALELPY